MDRRGQRRLPPTLDMYPVALERLALAGIMAPTSALLREMYLSVRMPFSTLSATICAPYATPWVCQVVSAPGTDSSTTRGDLISTTRPSQ